MNILPQDNTPRKKCKGRCGRLLLATTQYFHAQKKGKYGVRSVCIECRSEQERAERLNPEIGDRRRSQERKSYASHKEIKADYQRRNCVRISEYQHWYSRVNSGRKRAYRQSRKEYFRAYDHQHRLDNLEYYQMRERAYSQTPRGREVGKAKEHRRRIRKMALPGELTAEQIRLKLRLQHFRCYYCHDRFEKRNGKYVFHLDHTIPVSRIEASPRHDMSYTVLACKPCNLKKHNKLPHEFFEGGRLL